MTGSLSTAARPGILLLLLAWLLPGVVGHDPWVPDEGYTLGIIHNMAATGDLVVPRLAADPFLEKPPLYYWTAAGLLRLLSPPLTPFDAARLATPLYFSIALLFTGLLARETWGRRWEWIAPLVFISAFGVLSHRHLMVTDIALLAGVAMGAYGLLLSRRSSLAGGAWLGTGAGVAFLSKGLLGPGILGLSALLLPLLFRDWRCALCAKGLAIAFLFALPWLLLWPGALYLRSPELFMTWFWDNNLGRYLGFSGLGPPAKPGYWWRNFPLFTFPLLPLALWYLWRRRREVPWHPGVQLAITVCLLYWAVLFTASTAQGFYLLPTLPLLALPATGALPLLPAAAIRAGYRASVAFFGLVALALWGFWAYAVRHGLAAAGPLGELAAANQQIRVAPWRMALALLYTAGWLVMLRSCRPPRLAALAAWPAGLVMAVGVAFTLYLPAMNRLKSFRPVVVAVAARLPGDACLADINLHENERGILHALAGITTEHVRAPHEAGCPFILVQTRRKYYPDGMNFGPRWREAWRGSRPGEKSQVFYLFRRVGRGRAE